MKKISKITIEWLRTGHEIYSKADLVLAGKPAVLRTPIEIIQESSAPFDLHTKISNLIGDMKAMLTDLGFSRGEIDDAMVTKQNEFGGAVTGGEEEK